MKRRIDPLVSPFFRDIMFREGSDNLQSLGKSDQTNNIPPNDTQTAIYLAVQTQSFQKVNTTECLRE